ncbi:dihydrolipoyl dehydrogenase [Acuticoccus sp. MNP-M23]|uniref:dihydrolipoyl dehydrogenase n=1 Tax=Acuticoccus sp. MNP-M23 TaxID=3072793 RepID=UPI002815E75B|nr:dihydrolipoyl dehydrogenase [Acuticoccus sp. MNP-M23]WMS41579.1 dihydrolipoyl dehydrogenase [Acuticoccus sp. MNP-M23]
MPELECDVAIIGAGTAGLSAERRARANGARTLLIDPAFAGTMCANVGCMPSKLLIAAAEAAHRARNAPVFGVEPGDITINGKDVMKRLRAERDRFVAATRKSFDKLPEGTAIKATARFTGPTSLALDNGDTVRARAVVIAAGSTPRLPSPFEALGDKALTNQTIFELEDLPRSLAVVGGGAIGLELAQAMARLGVDTALFNRGETLAGIDDEDVQSALATIIGDELKLHRGVDVTPEPSDDGIRLHWTGADAGERLFDKVLVATGRVPKVGGLDLESAGLPLDDNGIPLFDRETMQCGDAPVFIAGDVDGDVPILHEASNEGAVAGRNAALYPAMEAEPRTPRFTITFTDPPLAVVGAAPGRDTVVGSASYENQGRARVEARAKGLVRLYARSSDGRLTGAVLLAPGADHMAHLMALAIMRGETAASLLDMPFYHPTLEEGLKPALREICHATPAVLKNGRDPDDAPGA